MTAAGSEAGRGVHGSSDELELQPVSFSAKALQRGRHPVNMRRMEKPDAQATRHGWCGEVMEMYLSLEGERIVDASFWVDGCVPSVACGDMLTALVRGLTVDQAHQITPADLVLALDGLPYASRHCAELSVDTMRAAIAGWLARRSG